MSILTAAGDRYEGVLAQATLENGDSKITLKMTKRTTSTDTRANGDTSLSSAFTGTGPDFSMSFAGKEVAEISLPSLNLPEPAKAQNGTFGLPAYPLNTHQSNRREFPLPH